MIYSLPIKTICLTLVFLIGLVSACSQPVPSLHRDMPGSILSKEKPSQEKTDTLQEAYRYFSLASIALSEGNYKKARGYLSGAIENDPESTYLCKKMALVLKELNAYQEALVYALRSVDLDPGDVGSRVLLADVYTLMGKDYPAIEQYNNALGVEPENQRIRLLLATILIRKGRFQEAFNNVKTLTEQNPGLVIAHYYAGRINLELKQYPDSEKSFKEALKLNSKLEPALFDLGTLYQMTNRSEDAAETYKNLLALYPDNMVARERLVNLYFELGLKKEAEKQMQEIKEHSRPGERGRQALGFIYLRQGMLDESIEELNLIVSAWPNDYKSIYYLALAYEEKGDLEKALDYLKRIRPESKYFIKALIHSTYILDKQDKQDEAIALVQKAIALEQGQSELYLILASLYETKKEYEKAIKIIEGGLSYDRDNTDLIFRLGVLLDKSGDKKSCIEQMQKILDIDPDHADSLNYIGYTYAEQGIKLDEAMDLIKRASELKPDNGYIIDSLGWVYYQKGLYNEAVRHLERAAELTPDDPTIKEHLGDACLKQKTYAKALTHYEAALLLAPLDENTLKKKIDEVKQLLKQDN